MKKFLFIVFACLILSTGYVFFRSASTADKNVVILAVYHKMAFLLKNKIVMPIQAGREIENQPAKDGKLPLPATRYLHKNMIGDNTGENISEKNRFYSELTAVYWAWKNYEKLGNPAYIGLIHYRRQLLLTPPDPSWEFKNPYYIISEKPGAQYLENIGLTKENVLDLMQEYDAAVHRTRVSKPVSESDYMWRDPLPFNKNEQLDLNKVLQIVVKRYPSFEKDVADFSADTQETWANMFIMRRDIFQNYAAWLFDILGEIEKGLDLEAKESQRKIGIWAEMLEGLYMRHLENNGFRIKNLPAVFLGENSQIGTIEETPPVKEHLFFSDKDGNRPVLIYEDDQLFDLTAGPGKIIKRGNNFVDILWKNKRTERFEKNDTGNFYTSTEKK